MLPLVLPAVFPSKASRDTSGLVLLGRTARRSLPADRPPPSLGVHKGSFEALTFFAELQTIFLDPTVALPSQIDVLTHHDRFHESRQSGLRMSYW